jgi:Bacterial Ig-like domain (group 2)
MHSRLATCVVLIAGSRHIFNLLLLGLLALSWTGCGSNSTPAPRTLLSIAVQPGNGEATTPMGTLPFTVTGTFDQPPITQDNLNAQWSSSDTTVATVDPNTGLATCLSAGAPVVITASSGAKQGTAQLTCLASVPPPGSGNCAYICPSTRCGELTGFCSDTQGNACRQVYDPGRCPIGKPAGGTATDSCGVGIDTTRACP